MWLNGPYECGAWPDISIFRNLLMTNLAPAERVEADDGYVGEAPLHVKCPRSFTNKSETEAMQQRVQNQQETVNNRFSFGESYGRCIDMTFQSMATYSVPLPSSHNFQSTMEKSFFNVAMKTYKSYFRDYSNHHHGRFCRCNHSQNLFHRISRNFFSSGNF